MTTSDLQSLREFIEETTNAGPLADEPELWFNGFVEGMRFIRRFIEEQNG